MFRNGASRAVFRSLQYANIHAAKSAFNGNAQKLQLSSRLPTLATRRPQPTTTLRLTTSATVRYQSGSSGGGVDKIDKKAEEKHSHDKLKPTPETVSSTSSVHPIMSEVATEDTQRDVDMMAGVKSDLHTIKDTFNLSEVPREAYVIGLAGVVPYLATSLATVYCAWDINHAAAGGGFLLTQDSATALLAFLEPLQIGYGAVILSSLGTIHWGLEWAGYGGYHGYRRYLIGVAAPALAWPTVLLPHTAALTSQFLAFIWLYYVDAQATRRAWTPPWYGMYRFVLTFIVGASIVVSLIGRGEIVNQAKTLPGPTERLLAIRFQSTQLATKEGARAEAVGSSEEDSENEESAESGDKEEKDSDDKDGKEDEEGDEQEGDKKDEEKKDDDKKGEEKKDGDKKDDKKK